MESFMEKMVLLAIQGDKDAFVKLIQDSTQGMYKVARAILSNEEDVVDAMQETTMICFEKITSLKKPQYFKTWLIRILINQCNDIIRKAKREWIGETYVSDTSTTAEMDHWEFVQILQGLDEKYRLIVILYYVEELKVREIAKLLDMRVSTVKTRLARGREELRVMYGISKKKVVQRTEEPDLYSNHRIVTSIHQKGESI